MAGVSWSSTSSCTSSLGSLDDDDVVCVVKPDSAAAGSGDQQGNAVKFLCSYGGRILPRHRDGALRYIGGDNRVLSVHRSLQFLDLQVKLREMCGWEAVSLRCQLPTEDLDALVTVTTDDDLANLLDEYDAAAARSTSHRKQPLKIRAFLFPRAPTSTTAALPQPPSSPVSTPARQFIQHLPALPAPSCAAFRWGSPPGRVPHQMQYLIRHDDDGGEARPHRYLVHNGGQWQ